MTTAIVDLTERWQERLNHLVRTTIKQLKNLSAADHPTKFQELTESARAEIGKFPSALLKQAPDEKAAQKHPLISQLVEEIRIAASGADPVTGA